MISACLKRALCAMPLLVVPTLVTHADADPSIQRMKSAVVEVRSLSHRGDRPPGSGVVIAIQEDYALVLTAAHVVRHAREIRVRFFSDQHNLRLARLVRISPSLAYDHGHYGHDLAVLRVPNPPPTLTHRLELDPSTHLIGAEDLLLIGFPLDTGTQWATKTEQFVGYNGDLVEFSGCARLGFSGGPLIHNGKVVGITLGIHPRNTSFAIKSEIIHAVLQGWGISITGTDLGRILVTPWTWNDAAVTGAPSAAVWKEVALDGKRQLERRLEGNDIEIWSPPDGVTLETDGDVTLQRTLLQEMNVACIVFCEIDSPERSGDIHSLHRRDEPASNRR